MHSDGEQQLLPDLSEQIQKMLEKHGVWAVFDQNDVECLSKIRNAFIELLTQKTASHTHLIEEVEKMESYIEWSNSWIEAAADFTYAYCEKCGEKAIEDGDGDPDVATRDWLFCTNPKCDNPISTDGGNYRDLPGEAQGLLQEYKNISLLKRKGE